jgi:hypothetical protein
MPIEEPRNPYRPGVGVMPVTLAGRESELLRFEAMLRGSPHIPANIRLTGLRGVGKSVLLSEMGTRASGSWAVVSIELEPRHNSEDSLKTRLVAALEESRHRLSRLEAAKAKAGKAIDALGGVSLKWEDLSLSFDPQAPAGNQELAKALAATVEVAVRNKRLGLALLLDEAQVLRDDITARGGECPLSMLLAAVSTIQRAGVPLALALCGLPTLVTNLIRARSYTERMFRGETIGSLVSPADREAFEGPLKTTPIKATADLVDRVLRDVEGYPYFIQLWGAELWDAARQDRVGTITLPLLRAIQSDIHRRLDQDFYRPRLDSLTPAEQELLIATTNCPYPPLRIAEIKKETSKSTAHVNVLLGRLVTAGILYRVRQGVYDYTAPQFHNFLARYRTSISKQSVGTAHSVQAVTTVSSAGYVTNTGPGSTKRTK